MTSQELRIWKQNKLQPRKIPINRNIKLLSTPKDQWTVQEVENANKVISYIARARGIEKEYKKNNPKDKSLTPNRASLRSWGYDVFKKRNYKKKK